RRAPTRTPPGRLAASEGALQHVHGNQRTVGISALPRPPASQLLEHARWQRVGSERSRFFEGQARCCRGATAGPVMDNQGTETTMDGPRQRSIEAIQREPAAARPRPGDRTIGVATRWIAQLLALTLTPAPLLADAPEPGLLKAREQLQRGRYEEALVGYQD